MAAQSALCTHLQLRPGAFAWRREKQELVSRPWKRRKRRADREILGPGCGRDNNLSQEG
jgi:hypothetical protein